MELTDIEKLLEKYWKGETSVDEEHRLQNYFSQEQVPRHLKAVAPLFQKFAMDRNTQTLEDDFDDMLLSQLEKPKKSISLNTWLGIAAAFLLLFFSAILVNEVLPVQDAPQANTTQSAEKDTYEDPRLAYEQTKEALLLISTMMNKGTQQVEKLEKFHEAQITVKPE